jgi:hypothetical protein
MGRVDKIPALALLATSDHAVPLSRVACRGCWQACAPVAYHCRCLACGSLCASEQSVLTNCGTHNFAHTHVWLLVPRGDLGATDTTWRTTHRTRLPSQLHPFIGYTSYITHLYRTYAVATASVHRIYVLYNTSKKDVCRRNCIRS